VKNAQNKEITILRSKFFDVNLFLNEKPIVKRSLKNIENPLLIICTYVAYTRILVLIAN